MNLEPIRQAFRPLFGVERRETTSRLFDAILISTSETFSDVILMPA